MKLAIICSDAPEPRETFLQRDIAALRTRFDVRVFGLAQRFPTLSHLGLLAGHSMHEAASLALRLRTVREIADFVADGGAIFAHFAWTTADIAAAASRLSGRPWFCFVHAWDVFTRPPAELRRRTATASRVIACSRLAADACTAAGIPHPALIHHSLPDAISNFRLPPSPRQLSTPNSQLSTPNSQLSTPNSQLSTSNFELSTLNSQLSTEPTSHSDFNIVSVGRLVEKKGFDILLRAWPTVRDAIPKARLRLVGDGPCATDLHRLAKTSSGKNRPVEFTGALPEEETLRAIAAANLFVLPSRRLADGDRDGIANAVLEAMALGVPVITTDAGAAGEAVTNGLSGLLLPSPATPESLASAIIRLAQDDHLRTALSKNAKTTVREQFSTESYLAAIDTLLSTTT